MTPADQNASIAKSLGWRYLANAVSHSSDPYEGTHAGAAWLNPTDLEWDQYEWWEQRERLFRQVPPNYVGCLNAMHSAWRSLPWDKQCEFSLKLHEVCGSNQLNHVVNATAAQRAEAFLRVKGLYKEST